MSISKIFGAAALVASSFVMAGGHSNAPEAGSVPYTGPKMDLSQFQPEFRVGFLGDESAQDILARNECLGTYVEQRTTCQRRCSSSTTMQQYGSHVGWKP
jgi:hypothetical protein